MKPSALLNLFATAAIAASVPMLVSPAHAADDQTTVTRSGTYTNSKGGSGTASSVTTRSNGTVERKGTWTNAAGGTGSFQSQRTFNKATQTGTFSGSVTRPNGATTSYQGTAVRNAPGSISSKGTITLANGKQDTFTSTDTRVAPGSWAKQQVITTASGQTIDRSVDTTVSGGNGTRTVTTTLPSGQTLTRNANFTQTVSTAPAATPTN
jgi:hypothetical protein